MTATSRSTLNAHSFIDGSILGIKNLRSIKPNYNTILISILHITVDNTTIYFETLKDTYGVSETNNVLSKSTFNIIPSTFCDILDPIYILNKYLASIKTLPIFYGDK